MRTIEEQVAGLQEVYRKVPKAQLCQHYGENFLRFLRLGNREVCFVSGGYDCWRLTRGEPKAVKFDVSADEAAQFLTGTMTGCVGS